MKKQLTRREHWLLWRKRRNLTQRDTALQYGVSEWTVVQWDKGRGNIPKVRATPPYTPGELCWLERRKSGMELEQIAGAIGVTRLTILNWERDIGDTPRLARYWDRWHEEMAS